MKRYSKFVLLVGFVGVGTTIFMVAGHSSPEVRYVPLELRKQPARRHHPIPGRLPQPRPATQFGDPLPGLTPAQLVAFATGLDEFQNVEDVAGGLGPTFNNVSCGSCHSSGALGGGSNITVTRFGKVTNGVYDALELRGGSLLQDHAIDPGVQEIVPPEANVVAHRQSTPLFGLGLIEAIPDEAIQRNAAEQLGGGPRDGLPLPGSPIRPPYPPAGAAIRGRVSVITDVTTGKSRVGRFGWKGQQATLLAFAGDAYLNEMGITNRFFPKENAPNGDATKLAAYDSVADIEDAVDVSTGTSDIDVAADFMRYLAPPPQLAPNPSSRAGSEVFQNIECASCHKPLMMTGSSPVEALNRKPVALYSDLLLHDMGSLGDGIAQAAAGPTEFRTPPLWGLRVSGPYLHDGRAATIDEAIRAHDGQAKRARDFYLQLSPGEKRQLLDFLGSI
ncbi:hypothetical protein IAD21_00491 [Abditibacteriota bacterium]|nr:hypothetical protein IAD21_00491 [Abditibacteriota bacterium]